MKAIKLLVIAALALIALGGVVMALSWGQPTTAQAQDDAIVPAAPLTLPPPYLSDANVANAPYGASPAIDGRIAPGEYAGAHKLSFPTYGGNLEVFIRQNAITLYIAFDSPDTAAFPTGMGGPGPAFQVFLDTNNSKDSSPQPGDYLLTVNKGGGLGESQGDGIGGWGGLPTGNWVAAVSTATWGWQGEFAIALSKLGITQTGPISIGLGLAEVWTPSWPHDWYWPSSGYYLAPSTWGHLVSSSDWGIFYWKPGPWQDYAPSGMPDFDQKQSGWNSPGPTGPISTHCGPVAAANSLWWFDSKFETADHSPPMISDTYRLITSYNSLQWDDHSISNVVPLVNDLARYFGTNQGIVGTSVISMFFGSQQYLRDRGLWDDYIVTLVVSPTFDWVADEVMRSEDVILLLGFYEPIGPGQYRRVGGHFVSVAGVGPMMIAFSDPFVDNAETGQPGRVLSGTLLTHYPPHPGSDATVHNDAGNISHDAYMVVATNSPGGVWGPANYPLATEPPGPLMGANPHPRIETEPWGGGLPLQVEVEFALAVSPYTWKASGYRDYAPNGVPDIDQKQDNWMIGVGPGGPQWSFCGPVAAANSMWWFDSKFEPEPVTPTAYNDNYPLVQSYNVTGIQDDHDPNNVDGPLAWPQVDGLVEDLALRFGTDQIGSGTIITNLYVGIEQYITDHNLRQGYVITQVARPEFWWVAEEAERSEDVILLLGFYFSTGGPIAERVGGHYVTVPGVDKQGGLIAFSDPYWDRAETWWPYAYPGGWPQWMGRVANGWLTPHTPIPHITTTLHNDAGTLSHDVYYVTATTTPGGVWGPMGYVSDTSQTTNFQGMNGGGIIGSLPILPIQTEVEWAVAVSPVADVWITKTVAPTVTTPGAWVTFTINFGNAGSLPADNVAIVDVLPSGLTNITYTYKLNYTGVLTTYDTYTWTVGTLGWNQGGVITITARVDPTIADPQRIITNTADITTTTQEQYQVQPLPNRSMATLTVQTADVEIAKSVTPAVLRPGDRLTYTIIYTNAGPAMAASTVITDLIPSALTNVTYTYSTNYGLLALLVSDTYIWQAGDVPAGKRGIITVTAQVSPGLTSGGPITNDVSIATVTPESDYSDNAARVVNTLCMPPAGASFSYSPLPVIVSQPAFFTGTVSLGSPPLTYAWNWTDGIGGGNPISHTYTAPGNYTASMTVTNACGQGVYSQTVSVCRPVAGASFTYTPLLPLAGQVVTLSASTSAGSGVISYAWVGDDGWTASGSVVTHAFALRGSHTVWLTATNACGQSAYSGTIFVREYGLTLNPPAAQQTGNPGSVLTYTLIVQNLGNYTDTFSLSKAGNVWTTTLPAAVGPVEEGGSAQFDVVVQIPGNASHGASDNVAVAATSQADLTKSDAAVLATRVAWRFIYLPVVLRN